MQPKYPFRTATFALAFSGFSALSLALWNTPAQADSRDHVEARKLRESGEILPLERIVERARAAKAGDIIETELKRKDGRYVYEIDVLDTGGQVWELKLDARTGEVIKMERDD